MALNLKDPSQLRELASPFAHRGWHAVRLLLVLGLLCAVGSANSEELRFHSRSYRSARNSNINRKLRNPRAPSAVRGAAEGQGIVDDFDGQWLVSPASADTRQTAEAPSTLDSSGQYVPGFPTAAWGHVHSHIRRSTDIPPARAQIPILLPFLA